MKSFIIFLLMHGVNAAAVTVMEGDSVTLGTDFKTNKRDRIRWYFNDTRIAQISGDLSKTCTDVQCNEGTERFRDRLELDHQTGSLTITNTRNTDSGDYHQETVIRGRISEEIFSVTITGSPGPKKMMRKMGMEGASDILDNGEAKTSGSDGRDEVSVLSAIKPSALDQDSGNSGVTVGVTLMLVIAVGAGAVGVIHCLGRKPKQKRQKDKSTRDGLMLDEKSRSEEI